MTETDIVIRLRDAISTAHDMPPREAAMLFSEAAGVIEDLRLLVGIRAEIELEDMPAEGRA